MVHQKIRDGKPLFSPSLPQLTRPSFQPALTEPLPQGEATASPLRGIGFEGWHRRRSYRRRGVLST